jgi:endonuclease G
VVIKNKVFEVEYSQKLKQPLMLKYESTNRPTNVNRGSMDFYLEPKIITSGPQDYKNNEWDKGHLAPAASFSDNMENLKQTFSYLNCALQQQDLNRGEWRLLEEQERVWDDKEPLMVKIELLFDNDSKVLPSGATIPSYLVKHIHFHKTGVWKCYKFQNIKPTNKWPSYEIKCIKH